MSTPAFETALHKFRESHSAAKKQIKKLTMIGQILSLVLFGVILAFLASLYGKVTTMYQPENFEQPLRAEAAALIPQFEPMLQSLWAETAPVYREMAREKFQTALPAFQTSSRTEWEALRANLAENAGNKVQAALGRISKRQQRRLAEHFPRLSTKKGTDEIGTGEKAGK